MTVEEDTMVDVIGTNKSLNSSLPLKQGKNEPSLFNNAKIKLAETRIPKVNEEKKQPVLHQEAIRNKRVSIQDTPPRCDGLNQSTFQT